MITLPAATGFPAERLLFLPLRPITSARSPYSPGDANEFYSEADYWWPSPETPECPYVGRDGQSNPDCFNRHRKLLIYMSFELACFVKGFLDTGDKRLFDQAEKLLRMWFVNPETAMKPHLDFAQAIRNWIPGRNFGVIDSLHLAEAAIAVKLILKELSNTTALAVRKWFRAYLDWLINSVLGAEERKTTNNHSVCWYLQAASFALLLDDNARIQEFRHDFKQTLLAQLASDGSFPLELGRTKPYGYSLFQFEVISALALVLSTPQENCFFVANNEGASLAKAAEWLYPYLKDPGSWPFPKDVRFAECWPAKQSGMLFSWYCTGKKKYLDLWQRMNHRRLCFEYFRNFPIRTPDLWLRWAENNITNRKGC